MFTYVKSSKLLTLDSTTNEIADRFIRHINQTNFSKKLIRNTK